MTALELGVTMCQMRRLPGSVDYAWPFIAVREGRDPAEYPVDYGRWPLSTWLATKGDWPDRAKAARALWWALLHSTPVEVSLRVGRLAGLALARRVLPRTRVSDRPVYLAAVEAAEAFMYAPSEDTWRALWLHQERAWRASDRHAADVWRRELGPFEPEQATVNAALAVTWAVWAAACWPRHFADHSKAGHEADTTKNLLDASECAGWAFFRGCSSDTRAAVDAEWDAQIADIVRLVGEVTP